MRKHNKFLLAVLIAASILPFVSAANPSEVNIPSTVNYYARLKDADGKPLTGRVSVKTFLYDSATEGMSGDLNDEHLIYAEDYGDVSVTRGRLALSLGGGEPLGRFSGSSFPMRAIAEAGGLYLELQIGTERLSPRQWIGFGNSSFGAEYAAHATNLSGPLLITTSSFPSNMSAGNISCGGSNGYIAAERLPAIQHNAITAGEFLPARVPGGISLSKLSPANGALSSDRLPNVSALKIQSGTFGSAQLPANVIGPTAIQRDAAEVAGSGATVVSGAGCHCMAALHSTLDGGDEGMNTVNIGMPLTGGAISCVMTFEEGTTKPCDVSYMCVCID